MEKLHRALKEEVEENGHEGVGGAAEEVQSALDVLGDYERGRVKLDENPSLLSDCNEMLRLDHKETTYRARLDMSKTRLKEIKQAMRRSRKVTG